MTIPLDPTGIRHTKSGFILSIKVSPNASKNEIGSWENGRLRVRITASPEKGKANAAVEALIAKAFNVPKSSVSVIRGTTSRDKEVEILN